MNRTQGEQRQPWYERNRTRRLSELHSYLNLDLTDPYDAEYARILERESFDGASITVKYELEKTLNPLIEWLMERFVA